MLLALLGAAANAGDIQIELNGFSTASTLELTGVQK